MSKKDKKKKHLDNSKPEGEPSPLISRRGWKIIGGGLGVLVLGFLVLTLADPRGQNFASHLSPFLILGGYGLIGWGLLSR